MPAIVVTYPAPRSHGEHERATHSAIAKRIALLQGWAFAGDYDPAARYDARLYFVPSDTLVAAAARRLGIRGEDGLFGGVVPYPHVATKAIVHPLVAPDAAAPRGWSAAFAQRVRELVLPGFSAFSQNDVRRAALQLLAQGPVRVKPGLGIGGRGQHLVADASEIDAVLDALDPAELECYGAAIETHLADVTTYSIGRVRVAGTQIAYCGTQCMTTDNGGGPAFGGSDLIVARGGFPALARLSLAPEPRFAIGQAQAFDDATSEFSGFFASRRNYDAVRGLDRNGQWRCGILEQSWRIGGASGAEVAALAALRAEPALRVVRARCTEAYGSALVPPGALVDFSGVDAELGLITKFTVVEAYEAA